MSDPKLFPPRSASGARRWLGVLAISSICTGLLLPAAADESRLGEHTFRFPDGFEVERVAGPPLVDRPIVADFDEEGHLYVADSSGSSEKVQKQLETRPHRILRLEDVDGDGRFDRRTVFADRMMFPEGTLWYDGSLYVSAPPSIWKLTDTDGDGICDRREEWFQGKTLTGCANDLHGPYLGLDGRIYWAKGAFAEQTYPRAGRPPLVTRAAHIFRSRADGSDIEPVMTGGMDNPVDVVVLPAGERIFTTTFLQHPGGGKRDGLIHAIYGGVYGKRHGVLDGHPRTGDLMPVLSHLGPAAPCGLTRYRSTVFGEDYRDNLFATLFNLHKVTRHVLAPQGATYRSRDEDFLVSDNPDFHPTDVLDDADGSLLVVDTGGWYKLCCPSSQLYKPDVLGAIYRVRRLGVDSPDDPRGLELDWAAAGSDQVVARLGDVRPAVRSRARTALAGRGEEAVAALLEAMREEGDAALRRNAVWAAAAISGGAAREVARAALSDADATVRQAAAHSAGLWRDRKALGGLVRLLEAGPDPLRRAAAEALGRLEDPAAVPALLAACRRSADRALEHSLTFALIEIGDAIRTELGLRSESPSVRRAALVALDQMEDSQLEARQAAPMLVSEVATLREAAEWIVARHPEWAADLATSLRERLSTPTLQAGERDDLAALLARFASDPSIEELLSDLLDGGEVSDAARVTALRAVGRSRLEVTPQRWTAALARLLEGSDPRLRGEVFAAARGLRPGAQVDPCPLAAALLRIGRDPRRPPDVRVDALSALALPLKAPDGDLLAFLLDCIEPSRPVKLQTESARILAAAELDREQRRSLLGAVRKAGPLAVGSLLAAFEKVEDEALGLELVEALGQSPLRAALPPDTLARWLKAAPPAVRERGEELLEGLETDLAAKRARLEELEATLKDGDVRRGQKVFNDPKAACVSCHAIGYLGGKIGPDLTRIGRIRSERDLLESLIYPSASFVQSYEPYVVVSKNGEVWTGILREETGDEIVLVSGPEAGARVRVPRGDILEMRPGKTSIMPAGLTEQLTRQQIADLLAFLEATKW